MNIFLYYQERILSTLKDLEKKKIIKIPNKFKGLSVELPPKNTKAAISCNAALILAKHNNISTLDLATILKKKFLYIFNEFESIEVAGPGFLNINFDINFWRKHLLKIVQLNKKYGSAITNKKKYNIEFVSANPTGPLHVGHCRGAILGDALSNMLIFNNNKVTKEYYVNDHGGQIINFVKSVYFRILEIKNNKPFPDNENLYPGDYIIAIAKKIIKKGKIKNPHLHRNMMKHHS